MKTRAKPPIAEELARFLESGLAITVATRDGTLQPDGAWGWAVQVEEDRHHLLVFLHPDAATAMLRNLGAHPEIAVVLDQPTSHRACQVKGAFVSTRPGRTPERKVVERQVEAFRKDLEVIGIPPGMTQGWTLWPAAALRVRVEQLFEQTPGPGTGGPLQ